MSKIFIDLFWKLNEGKMLPNSYSNQHEIIFTPEIKIVGDSAPDWRGDELNINPEQTLAASLSSCHMMTFLALAAKMKWPVISYKDNAVAILGKNSKNLMSVIKIELNPKVVFSNGFSVVNSEMNKIQNRAHRYCFIANSLSEEVKVSIN
tara:strand:+ start:822 stop:1271 length:450 start_codon:yes stop_codon:yes gene_type:complete